ncbi:hypothetical protein [uncultured Microscilla sp.]|uniref:hypothetical protein n=1 Tax=uncultured Microscilla sp. TaxID=432653 RepID=UPI002632060B|nr:hypothetical protein [uncultured Microscilla sp.]
MLRTYKSINHPIFKLHEHLEHLVCQVWCNATNHTSCSDFLSEEFEIIYNEYSWLKKRIDSIYKKCKTLNNDERAKIREAFNINNRIEELCEGTLSPIELDDLPKVVKNDMKPLLIKFYDYLIDRAAVPGDKLDYYNKLISTTKHKTCPCCGLARIESAETHYREDNDHYLPKAEYPFASVNFKNLVPLCDKCNKKCKGSKNPCKNGRISYYPFNKTHVPIEVFISINNNDSLDYLNLKKEEIEISFSGNPDKNSTWDFLFEIKRRYNEEIRNFSKSELRVISNRMFRHQKRKQEFTYEQILNDSIEDYEFDIFEERKFLKKSFLETIKLKPEWMAVYQY